ncbi:hypothetical protein K490DRAFT_73821 [Saccharata proteae CBS 121410]|uniref:Rhodopsin domain-containing protein n=1 Tax=Saccharata proteae CBS 121410 TaxID=1314787 RepID=A0A9P4HWS8_9PEZI|nr:hypothetical protein K490DRAFT_73821 [Saccharata proteae CBS 121410]
MTIDPVILANFGEPPDGVDLSESKVHCDNIVVVVILILAVLSVVLRMIARGVQKSGLEFDDYLILGGTAFVIPTVGLCIASGAHGCGTHIWSVNHKDLVTMFQLLYSYPWIYAACVTFTKFSIILFYFRIFGRAGRNYIFTIPCYLACFLNAIYPIIMWSVMGAACKPVSFYWNSYIGYTDGKCINVNQFFLALGITNMLNDVLILIIPIPQVWRLQLPTKKKISVVAILLLGGFVCVASCIRIYYLTIWDNAVDLTWAAGPVFIWSSIEPAMGILSACLPTLGPLFLWTKEKSFGSSGNNRYSQTPNLGSENQHWQRKSKIGANTSFNNSRYLRGDRSFSQEEDEIKLTNIVAGGHKDGDLTAISEDSFAIDGNVPEHVIVQTTRIERQVS